MNGRVSAARRSILAIRRFTLSIVPVVEFFKGVFLLPGVPPCDAPVLDALDNRVRLEVVCLGLENVKRSIKAAESLDNLRKSLHLCVLTNREPNGDVHLNNNYCFRCRLPNAADAKSWDRCIRQFDDLLLKFHRLRTERRRRRKNEKSFSIENLFLPSLEYFIFSP